ncbi:LppX_LprAFG lipoprotein [Nocardioides marmorisolisilvae]|uniref:LppX_LprAFG lipoprotein n=1 Tax=Nocardioides marmorisolisilvae TaxID=1542737 RepID=A0A3N0DTS1_9ACTN|nr:LppX_LprAFG lipoprotein [Nocardioides marmorisolisilvae]RNL79024.1 LppX_LprAFG lipoprotein [Nocardioides marmorisolisilvae]
MFRVLPRNRAFVAVLAAVALLVPLAGCGGSDKPKTENPAAFLKRVTAAMAKQHTAKRDLELGSSLSATAVVEYTDKDTSMAVKMVTGPQTVNVVLADGVMYLQQTKGSKYLKIDKSDPALGNLASQLGGFGPKTAVESLRGAVTKVTPKGTETIDGVKLDRYVLTVDTKKASSLFGVPEGSAKTPASVKYEFWLDGDGLLRQAKLRVSGQTLVMKVSDWGKPVTITVPPASQIIKH